MSTAPTPNGPRSPPALNSKQSKRNTERARERERKKEREREKERKRKREKERKRKREEREERERERERKRDWHAKKGKRFPKHKQENAFLSSLFLSLSFFFFFFLLLLPALSRSRPSLSCHFAPCQGVVQKPTLRRLLNSSSNTQSRCTSHIPMSQTCTWPPSNNRP